MLSLAAPNERLAASDKLSHIKWFGDVVIGAGIEQGYDGFLVVTCGQNEHGSLCAVPSISLQDFQATQGWEHEVQNEQIIGARFCHEQALRSIMGYVHCTGGSLSQCTSHVLGKPLLILYH